MTSELHPSPAGVVPQRCYRNAQAAIEMLESTFGFEATSIVRGTGADIAYARLWAGEASLLLGSLPASSPWNYRSPVDVGGANTGAPYFATPNIDALYARAIAAGFEIVSPLADTDYGSRDFAARDGERFLWNVGTYRPAGSTSAVGDSPQVYAGMRYADARSAMSWLAAAFGAVEHLVVPGEGNAIVHAELLVEKQLFMLGSGREDDFTFKTPLELGGAYTQSLNVYVADPDTHCARAQAAGALIVTDPADATDGTRGYSASDCEGYVWKFSTNRPSPPREGGSKGIAAP